jgi:hypothetical protein
MTTPPSAQPRLPDTEKQADSDVPDLDLAHRGRNRSRIPDDEKDERIPDAEE